LLPKDSRFCKRHSVVLLLKFCALQDYHRFHVPVSGTLEKFVEIPGCLYTVNPIAVNSKYCNVFTENKRVVSIISTSEFGKVCTSILFPLDYQVPAYCFACLSLPLFLLSNISMRLISKKKKGFFLKKLLH
jgi:type III secretory pathway component EscU